MKISADIDIQAPIETVFGVFSDLSKLKERVGGIIEIELLEGPAQMAVGTKWKEVRQFGGKEATEIMWVTELNQNKNYVVEAESHGTKYRSEYTFSEEGGATHVSVVFEGKPVTFGAKLMSFMAFLFMGHLKKLLHQDMVDLKKVCEE